MGNFRISVENEQNVLGKEQNSKKFTNEPITFTGCGSYEK